MIPGGLIGAVNRPPDRLEPTIPWPHGKITIQKVGENYLLWDPDIVISLGEHLGIVGTPTGTLPRKPRQNKVLGLPVRLMKEQAYLLVQGGIGRIEEPAGMPVSHDSEGYLAELEQSYSAQNRHLQASIYERSREFVEKPVEVPPHLALREPVDVSRPAYHLQRLFHTTLPEHWTCDSHTPSSVPLTPHEHNRAVVLQDLYRRRYSVTSGSKFGGDFLVYPGEPLAYHAWFVVRVGGSEGEVGAEQVLGFARVASSVNKVAVLANVGEGGRVEYVSLRWSGLS